MGKYIQTPDENFLKVHPDLAALYREVRDKENALHRLKTQKKILKEQLRTTKNELSKRLTVLEAWQSRSEKAGKTSSSKRRASR